MIINPYLVVPGTPPYDPDAQAFITATSISGGDATAINELVLDLKGANIWTKFNALYPIIGTTATQQKFNLKNPLDTNAAFRLSFQGGWTHSATGATPNGINAYANPFLNPSVNLVNNSTHISFYSRTNIAQSSVDWGVTRGSAPFDRIALWTKWIDNNLYSDQYNDSTNRISYANSASTGFYISSRTTSTLFKVHKNGSVVGTNTNSSVNNTPNGSLILSALNTEGSSISLYSTRQYAFASIGSGLTDTESQLFYQIVEKYQVALGRNINPLQSFYYNRNYNNETNAYLFSTQITNTTEQTALDTFVTSMKGYGIWSKMKAVYPIMGTTATQQKFNLVNAQDTNDAYRITFAGGWTHSSTGMTGNGTTTYANPNLIPSSVLTANNTHLSVYMGTDSAAGNKIEMGVGVGGTLVPIMMLMSKYTGSLAYSNAYNLSTNQITAANADARGFYVGSRTTSTSHKLYKNGSVSATDTNANPNTLPTQGMIIGALNSNGSIVQYTDRQYRFISIGDGLNDTESANFYTAVQALQTALGRAIFTSAPTVSDPDAQAFVNAANIVDQVESTAVNNLTIGLKADGLWTPMKAIYPILGGSSSSNSVNLKTPGTFNLTFFGGWSHSSLGATPNGSNAYANTSLATTGNVTQNSASMGFYNRTNTATVGAHGLRNSLTSPTALFEIFERYTDNNFYCYLNDSGGFSGVNSDSRGFFQGSRTASNAIRLNRNTSTFTGTSVSNGTSTLNVYIGASNFNNTATYYQNREISFFYIGSGLTNSEMQNYYTRVQAFNTALNRQV